MGSWGYAPFDSDDSRWFLYEIEDLVTKKLGKIKLNEYNTTDIIGAVYTLTQIKKAFGDDFDMIEDTIVHLHDLLIQIEDDKEWFDDWSDPASMKRSFRKTRKNFEQAFDEYLMSVIA
jgi:hypothetical protein